MILLVRKRIRASQWVILNRALSRYFHCRYVDGTERAMLGLMGIIEEGKSSSLSLMLNKRSLSLFFFLSPGKHLVTALHHQKWQQGWREEIKQERGARPHHTTHWEASERMSERSCSEEKRRRGLSDDPNTSFQGISLTAAKALAHTLEKWVTREKSSISGNWDIEGGKKIFL